MIRAACLALLALAPAIPGAVAAQEGPRLSFTLGAGVAAVPDYFGSDETEVGPSLSVNEGFLRFGGLSLGDEDPTDLETGFGFMGSFRYVPERSGGDFEGPGRLADPVDAAIEAGGGLSYTQGWYEAFAVARAGIGGHDDIVGEVGMDLIARPLDGLTLTAGPRLLYGTDGYAETYFSTTADTPTGEPAFDADGGLLSSGVEVGAAYDLTDRWGLQGTVRLDVLRGDAADSPIAEQDDQLSATVELTRRFDFRF